MRDWIHIENEALDQAWLVSHQISDATRELNDQIEMLEKALLEVTQRFNIQEILDDGVPYLEWEIKGTGVYAVSMPAYRQWLKTRMEVEE